MKAIKRISALLLGSAFFIAGILKLMDPVGTSLIVHEYLSWMHLGWLHFASKAAGICLALAETLLGAAMITGVWKRNVGIASAVLLGFFTILTLALLVSNPAMDCGCFGEAVHLTHTQSFIKNLVFLALWALTYLPLNRQEEPLKVKYASFALTALSVLFFTLVSAMSIPLVEFSDFKTGSELMLADDIDIAEGTPLLPISNAVDEYVDSLMLEPNLMVVSAYEPGKLSERNWENIESLMARAADRGFNPMLLVASSPERIAGTLKSPQLLAYTYFADRKDLMTLNRSNGGASYISDGQIIAKWSAMRLPKNAKLDELRDQDTVEALVAENNGSRLRLQGFLLYVFAVMILL